MRTFIIRTPEPHILDRGYAGAQWFALLNVAADPVAVGVRINRIGGKVVGLYFGVGRRRYLSVGRYIGMPRTMRHLMVGRA